MADEKSVREKWDAFVAEAKAATHLSVYPGATINAPVRISQIGPAPAAKSQQDKLPPKKDNHGQDSKPSIIGRGK